ncbi:MAG: carboxypeptidase regulatory-like domain-containing protein, partial [Gemmatimonadota bacterium]
MQRRLLAAMRLAIAGALLAPSAAAQQTPSRTIEVFVRDSATRLAIAGARVRATRDTSRSTVSDSTGRARLTIPMRPADTVIITRRGYRRHERPLANGGEEFLSFDVSLAPAPQELAELRVEERNRAGAPEGRLADFERRRAAGTLG